MTDAFNSNLKADIVSEACAWIVQIEEGNLTPADQVAFEEWINRSPVHKLEITHLARFSSELNILTAMRPSLDEAMLRRKKMRKPKNRWKMVLPLMMASISVVFLMLSDFFVNDNVMPLPDAVPAFYATQIGGQQDITLSDGSVVKLNTNTEVEIDFNAKRRKIRLIKGEAFFQVAHNPDRPFLVYAGDKVVRAVGTAFIVRHLTEKFEVTVTEGRVELKTDLLSNIIKPVVSVGTVKEPAKSMTIDPVAIEAGETITYNTVAMVTPAKINRVEKITKREIERELSWQDGLLEFSDTPLTEVIADLSRYTSLKIEISDPELRNLKFGGLFRTDELSVLFDTLETNFDIIVKYEDNDIIKISRPNGN
ncbi:MAG: FecR domain-containing protein [Robiginitomaculum sp.]